MVKVNFYNDEIKDEMIGVVVIACQKEGKWIFCRHRKRNTYEIPGGHREDGESLMDAAKRELYEETGAIDFDIHPLFVFGIQGKTKMNKTEDDESYGMMYYAHVSFLSELKYEIEEIVMTDDINLDWTYPDMHPILLKEVINRNVFD